MTGRDMTTELSQMKAVKMLIQLQFGGEKLKNNLATVLAFCSAKKKRKMLYCNYKRSVEKST